MQKNSFLKIYGLIPFLLVAFINAFVDLRRKIIIRNIIYKVYRGSTQLLLTAIVNTPILLPSILMFLPSEFLADKYPKNPTMKLLAAFSVVLTIIICISYYNGAFWTAFTLTFIMRIRAALHSPSRYSSIKESVGKDLLAMGNGAVNAASIVAILAGMSLFSLSFESLYDVNHNSSKEVSRQVAPLGFLFTPSSLIELYLAWRLPKPKDEIKESKFGSKRYLNGKLLVSNLKLIFENKVIWLCIIRISISWVISQLHLVNFPVLSKNELSIEDTFFTQAFLGFSEIGVVLGSLMAGRLSRNYIKLGSIPLGASDVFLMALTMPYLISLITYSFIFLIFSFCGTLFIVPLNSFIQFHTKENGLGKILAGSNFIQNIAMFTFLILTTLLTDLEIDVIYLLYFITLVAFLDATHVVSKLPFSLVRMLLSIAFLGRYRLLTEGFKSIPEKGGALLLGNHISFIDWAIVQMTTPRKICFIMKRSTCSKWYIKIFPDKFGVILVLSAANRASLELIAEHVRQGGLVYLFPKDVLSRHGQPNEFKGGSEHVCSNLEEGDGMILPFYIRGLWGSTFSRSDGGFLIRNHILSRRSIVIVFGAPMSLHSRKEEVKAKVSGLSFIAWESQCEVVYTIARTFIISAKRDPGNIAIIGSLTGATSYRKLLSLSFILGTLIKGNSKKINSNFEHESYAPKEECVGILPPAPFASSLLNLSVLLAQKIIVNLSFIAGEKAL